MMLAEDCDAMVRWPRYISPTKDYTDEKLGGLKGAICIDDFKLTWFIGDRVAQVVKFGDSTFANMFWNVEGGSIVFTIDAYHFNNNDKGSIEYVFATPQAEEFDYTLKQRRFCSTFAPMVENEFTKRCPEATAKADCAVM